MTDAFAEADRIAGLFLWAEVGENITVNVNASGRDAIRVALPDDYQDSVDSHHKAEVIMSVLNSSVTRVSLSSTCDGEDALLFVVE